MPSVVISPERLDRNAGLSGHEVVGQAEAVEGQALAVVAAEKGYYVEHLVTLHFWIILLWFLRLVYFALLHNPIVVAPIYSCRYRDRYICAETIVAYFNVALFCVGLADLVLKPSALEVFVKSFECFRSNYFSCY